MGKKKDKKAPAMKGKTLMEVLSQECDQDCDHCKASAACDRLEEDKMLAWNQGRLAGLQAAEEVVANAMAFEFLHCHDNNAIKLREALYGIKRITKSAEDVIDGAHDAMCCAAPG